MDEKLGGEHGIGPLATGPSVVARDHGLTRPIADESQDRWLAEPDRTTRSSSEPTARWERRSVLPADVPALLPKSRLGRSEQMDEPAVQRKRDRLPRLPRLPAKGMGCAARNGSPLTIQQCWMTWPSWNPVSRRRGTAPAIQSTTKGPARSRGIGSRQYPPRGIT